MPRTKKRQKLKPELNWYVLFGFNKSDQSQTGYFGKELYEIAEDIESARKFPSVNTNGISGFGTPEQWKDLINDDSDLNQGFKFHLVKTTLSD